MKQIPEFDLDVAHKHFSVECFNRAWELMDKPDRTAVEDEEMILLSRVSLWHWTQRADCTARNVSVGYWQASRIYALLGQAENARRCGQLCLAYGQEAGPFYAGYAYEALARAEGVAGDVAKMNDYLRQAEQQAEAVAEQESKKLLLADLNAIRELMIRFP